jgi:hypothetical protein
MCRNASQRESLHVSMISGNAGRPAAAACGYGSGSLQNPVYQLRGMMEHKLQHTISLLNRKPALSNTLLRVLPRTWHSKMKVKTLGPRSMSSAILFMVNALIGCHGRG